MRNYEVVFVAAPTLASEELEGFIDHIQTVVESKNGKVVKVDNWGKKSLAYKIKRFREGYYVVLTIEGDGSAIAELERRFRVTDYILRFISVRIDEAHKRSEKIKAERQKKVKSPAPPEILPEAKAAPAEPAPEAEAAPAEPAPETKTAPAESAPEVEAAPAEPVPETETEQQDQPSNS